MPAFNLGNVTALLKSTTPPTKKYVVWAKVLNPSFPDIVELNYWDDVVGAWTPLTDPTTNFWIRPVIDNTTTTPPTIPTEGDRYLIPVGATGVWAGKTDQVATWKNLAWQYQIPLDGFIVSVRTEANKLYDFRGIYGAGGFWGVNDFQVPIAPGTYIPSTEKGLPLGVATLDSSAKVPQNQIDDANIVYQPAVPASWPGGTDKIKEALDHLITISAFVSSAMDRINVVTTGGTITLNLSDKPERMFVGASDILADKIWDIIGITNALGIPLFSFFIQGGLWLQTMPANVQMLSWVGSWDTTTNIWTPPAEGRYTMDATYDGTNWYMNIQGPFN